MPRKVRGTAPPPAATAAIDPAGWTMILTMPTGSAGYCSAGSLRTQGDAILAAALHSVWPHLDASREITVPIARDAGGGYTVTLAPAERTAIVAVPPTTTAVSVALTLIPVTVIEPKGNPTP